MRIVVFLLAYIYAIAPALAQITTDVPPDAVTQINLMPPSKVYIDTTQILKSRAGYTIRKLDYGGCNTGAPYVPNNSAPSGAQPYSGTYYSGCTNANGTNWDTSGSGAGAFRIFCSFVKLRFDDPIVYPGQAGRTHLHAFYGNDTTDFRTDVTRMDEIGGSTCGGGIINRTGYWAPPLVYECPVGDVTCDQSRHGKVTVTPIANFYYKTWDYSIPVTNWPMKGLRMIAGDPNRTTVDTSSDPENFWECWNSQTGNPLTPLDSGGSGFSGNPQINSGPNGAGALPYRFDHLPTTAEAAALTASLYNGTGDPTKVTCDRLKMNITFPQCIKALDMLDSPDHKAHMAHFDTNQPAGQQCPVGYRAGVLPSIEGLFLFSVPPADFDHTRLSSDYSKAGAIAAGLTCATSAKNFCAGITGHMDYVAGWDQVTTVHSTGLTVPQLIMQNCYPHTGPSSGLRQEGRNCSDQVIGDVDGDGKHWLLGF